jgi:hypothetical protein
MTSSGQSRVATTTRRSPDLILPWLFVQLASQREPQTEGRAYILMFARGCHIKLGSNGLPEIPGVLNGFGIRTLADAQRAITIVEKAYELAHGLEETEGEPEGNGHA